MGELPLIRRDHLAVMVSAREMFVYGGCDATGPLNDAYLIDLEAGLSRRVWLRCPGVHEPRPRSLHAGVAYRSDLSDRLVVVHGGVDGDEVLSDTWLLDLDRSTCREMFLRGEGPGARCGHAMTPVRDNIVLVHGGDCDNMKVTNEVFALLLGERDDQGTMWWQRVAVDGHLPTLCSHKLVRLPKRDETCDDGVMVWGGFGMQGEPRHDAYLLEVPLSMVFNPLPAPPHATSDSLLARMYTAHGYWR